MQMYAATRDDHFELVVVDYDSKDVDVERSLRESSVNRWGRERERERERERLRERNIQMSCTPP